MIADDVVERVRASADIVQLIGESVPLKRSGSDWRGPCPFHNGKGPNFSVSPKRGSYHCFVCHEKGDIFTYVRKRFGLDWPAAVKHVGERVGVEVIDTPKRELPPDPNARNWEVLSVASDWFRRQLEDEDVGRSAREYLKDRSIDAAACERFGIGFSPSDAQSMRKYLHSLGFDDSRLLEAGLLVEADDQEPRARFRDRVMFPIQDEVGNFVGFGGRVMGNREPKYLNSSESSVFQKRRVLYGLNVARNAIRRSGRVLVVEGYMDAIRLALAGIEEVVAPLGTALTEEQALLLTRYTRTVYLLYDSDEAGLKATFRSGHELLRNRAEVRVVTLPPGTDSKDPDSFVRAQGAVALEAQIADSIDLFDRQIQIIERRGWFKDIKGRRTAIDRLLPTIRATFDPLTHDMYLTRLAEMVHVDKATLAEEADQPVTASGKRQRVEKAGEQRPTEEDFQGNAEQTNEESSWNAASNWKRKRKGSDSSRDWHSSSAPIRFSGEQPAERGIIRMMIADRAVVEQFAERFHSEDFRDRRYRAIFESLLYSSEDDGLDVVSTRLPEDALKVFRDIANNIDENAAAGSDVELAFSRLAARALEERIAQIRIALRATDSPNDQNALLKERMEVEKELRRLLPVRSTGKSRG